MYYFPVIKSSKEEKILTVIKDNNSVFISKIIEEFANNKYALPSIVADKVAKELNSIQKNPYDSTKDFYIYNNDCSACTKIESDDNLQMVIITTLDKKGELVARTVIKPPSFVTFYKDNNKK